MLEESLTNPKTSPADAALAVLFFIRQELPLGGAAAEARFIRLFPLLMEQLFGALQPMDTSSTVSQDSPEKDTILPFHHQGGGWLNRDRWLMRRSSSLTEANSSSSYSSLSYSSQPDTDPILELLSGVLIPVTPSSTHGFSTTSTSKSPILLDVLEEFAERKHTIHIGLPLGTLPYMTQVNFLSSVFALPANLVRIDPTNMLDQSTYSSYTSSLNLTLMEFHRLNAMQLFNHLLSIGLQDQTEISYGLRKWIISLAIGALSTTTIFPSPAHPLSTLLTHPQGGVGGFSPPPTFLRPVNAQSPAIVPAVNTRTTMMATSASSTPHGVGGTMMNRVSETTYTKSIQSLNIDLNMLEYYIFTFIRFPLASPPTGTLSPSKDDTASRKLPVQGSRGTIHSLPRVSLYETSYPSYYGSSRQPYGEAVYYECFKAYMNRYMKHSSTTHENSHIDRKSEFFVRLIIELWLDRDYLMSTTADSANTSTPTGHSDSHLLSAKECPLPLPIPKGLKVGRFSPLPSSVQKCLYTFTQHILSDPCIGLFYCDSVLSTARSLHSIVQPSLYNYIRVALRHAPVHDTNSSFYSALKLWLLWMEPWNAFHRKRTAANEFLHTVSDRITTAGRSSQYPTHVQTIIDTPKPSDPSKYSSNWSRYVKDNLHFYEVPLAIFLRRAREFDFSTREFDRSIEHIRKVFRVFSPLLLSISMDLKAYQNDMQVLLEEIVISHNRNMGEEDILDQIGKWLGIVDRKPSSLIEKVMEQGKLIVGFPLDFEVIPSKKTDQTKIIDENLSLSPERASDSLLTETGRKQLVAGARQCTRNIISLGDPMYFRPKSYEIPLLVQLTIRMSEKLNNYLGLNNYSGDPKTEGTRAKNASLARMLKQKNDYSEVMFRFNFRFLADYRNCLFILFVCLLIKLFYR